MKMKTVNSVSGGQTSAYISAKYPADYNIFALVRIEAERTIKDKKVIQYIEDKIQKPFIATAEDDIIIKTMIDLEQYIGKEIIWVAGDTFDEVIKNHNGNVPNLFRRWCTVLLKLEPMFNWWLKNINEVVEMRIGFRANETRRKDNQTKRLNKQGYLEYKHIVGKHKSGRNKWGMTAWQKPRYPLIEDNIYKDNVQKFWSDKPVKFAPINNCVGCFHQQLVLLRKRFDWFPEKMKWFTDKEGNKNLIKKTENNKHHKNLWRAGYDNIPLKKASKLFKQTSLFDINETDFNECDSGYCGL
jgi:hypothetical protein|tara:strand:+ start:858 stop:1754 length:897 start_codon:yes stop_codon:yes gene_type:complete